ELDDQVLILELKKRFERRAEWLRRLKALESPGAAQARVDRGQRLRGLGLRVRRRAAVAAPRVRDGGGEDHHLPAPTLHEASLDQDQPARRTKGSRSPASIAHTHMRACFSRARPIDAASHDDLARS